MPPKERLSKQEIVDAAFAHLRREGIEGLNARSLAAELGCSTMPLFRHFSGMEEIRQAAVNRAGECYNRYIQQGLSEPIPFKGVGRAYIRFAREEPQLFKLFFVLPHELAPEVPLADSNYQKVAEAASLSAEVSLPQAEKIYQQMWIFVHGIATLMASRKLDWDDDEISRQTSEIFNALKQHLHDTNDLYETEESS